MNKDIAFSSKSGVHAICESRRHQRLIGEKMHSGIAMVLGGFLKEVNRLGRKSSKSTSRYFP
jgi:hypothetical protein